MEGSKIVDLVLVKLEEKSAYLEPSKPFGPILIGGDDINELKPIYDYINTHLAEAANEMLRIVPLNHLIPKEDNNLLATELTDDDKVGWFEVPEDYLRLYSLRMKDWSRPVHEAIGSNHPNYLSQYNKYTRGNPKKPVAVYSRKSNKSIITYYSVDKDHTISEFLYIQNFNLVNEYTDKTAEVIALNTAKKVMEVFGNADGITIMQNELTSVLGNMQL